MVELKYRGKFNKSAAKPIPKSKHRITHYNATLDFVVCTCKFNGTAEAFEAHNAGKRSETSYTNILRDIKQARINYYLQGATGLYRPEEDRYFDEVPVAKEQI